MNIQILPHGGRLINRMAKDKEKSELEKKSSWLKKIVLNSRETSDLEMLASGAFSPLEGFMSAADYQNVVANSRLANGLVWTIPITLSATCEEVRDLSEGSDIALVNERQVILGILHLEQVYKYDKEKEARLVYKTTDKDHPGVWYLSNQGEYLLGGKVTSIAKIAHQGFQEHWFTPSETRNIFSKKGWRRIVGFQTRNPIHRAHEFVVKIAMEIVDGLFLSPLVGETKKGDIPTAVRIACYQKLLKKYFPQERVIMAVYGAAMRYAGPREAILHAIVRKNFGCTHFIVGRDHAGVGNYYGSFDAQQIFDEFTPAEIGITPLFFDHVFYCRRCVGMASVKTCPHPESDHFSLSGSKVRALLTAGEIPPPEFTRPEIANILLDWWRNNQ